MKRYYNLLINTKFPSISGRYKLIGQIQDNQLLGPIFLVKWFEPSLLSGVFRAQLLKESKEKVFNFESKPSTWDCIVDKNLNLTSYSFSLYSNKRL